MECRWYFYSEITDILKYVYIDISHFFVDIRNSFRDIRKYLQISTQLIFTDICKTMEIFANELGISPIHLQISPIVLHIL